MEKYKPNSHKSREQTESLPSVKKVDKVISGSAKIKKKSEFSKFASLFLPEDTDVKGYILGDIIIPMLKDAFIDTLSTLVYGEKGSRRSKKGSPASKISYKSYYEREDDRGRGRVSGLSTSNSRFDFNDIVLESRVEAEEVIFRMDEIIDEYRMVSIADMYDIVGISPPHTYNNYGWTDIRSAKVVRGREGYIIKMPKAIPLK